jgi:hypothetical protein
MVTFLRVLLLKFAFTPGPLLESPYTKAFDQFFLFQIVSIPPQKLRTDTRSTSIGVSDGDGSNLALAFHVHAQHNHVLNMY